MASIPGIKKLKNKKKIVMLTAYDYLTASYVSRGGADLILVGDTLGMVFAGYKNTLPVTVEQVIYHTKAVMNGAGDTPVVADMPFLSYQASVSQAIKSAGKIMKETLAHAVKLEGGAEVIKQVRSIIEAGMPVMGHIGLQPQSVNKYGGYPVTGKAQAEKEKLLKDASALEKAGVFAIVIEKVKNETAAEITKAVGVPVIGIGSGPKCDGQVLVTHDLLGAFEDFKPGFVKRYEKVAERSKTAVKKFIYDVKSGKYPKKKYYY